MYRKSNPGNPIYGGEGGNTPSATSTNTNTNTNTNLNTHTNSHINLTKMANPHNPDFLTNKPWYLGGNTTTTNSNNTNGGRINEKEGTSLLTLEHQYNNRGK